MTIELDDAHSAAPHDRGARVHVATIVAGMLLTVTAIAVVLLCAALVPGRLPIPRDPDVLDVIFDNRPVVWAARLLLVSAAFVLAVGGVFIVSSTLVRMKNGEWLKRAGPFEVAETALSELEDQVRFWQSATLDGQIELEDLQVQLDEANALIDEIKQAA
jgi:hypothetical protein